MGGHGQPSIWRYHHNESLGECNWRGEGGGHTGGTASLRRPRSCKAFALCSCHTRPISRAGPIRSGTFAPEPGRYGTVRYGGQGASAASLLCTVHTAGERLPPADAREASACVTRPMLSVGPSSAGRVCAAEDGREVCAQPPAGAVPAWVSYLAEEDSIPNPGRATLQSVYTPSSSPSSSSSKDNRRWRLDLIDPQSDRLWHGGPGQPRPGSPPPPAGDTISGPDAAIMQPPGRLGQRRTAGRYLRPV